MDLHTVSSVSSANLVFYVSEEERDPYYDQIEVWKSSMAASGPYLEITADAYKPAETQHEKPLTVGFIGAPKYLSGKTIDLIVDGSLFLSYTFTGVDPLSPADIAAQINTAFNPVAYAATDEFGQFVIYTGRTGRNAQIKTGIGDGLAILGIPTSTTYYGKDARIPLLPGQVAYPFHDPFSNPITDYYKIRLRSSSTGEVSDFSDSIHLRQVRVLPLSQLVRVYMRAVTLEGIPIENLAVTIAYADSDLSLLLEGQYIAGDDIVLRTDKYGKASTLLIRGKKLAIQVDGTSQAFYMTLPTDPAVTEVNLLDPAYASNDSLSVQRVHLPYAARRGT